MSILPEKDKYLDVFEGNTATFICPIQNMRPGDFNIVWLHRYVGF